MCAGMITERFVERPLPSSIGLSDEGLSETLVAGGLVVLLSEDLARRKHGGMFGVTALVSPANATIMAVQGRGLLSIVVDDAAGLQHMPGQAAPQSNLPDSLTSIEATECTGTGISAADRALTIRAAGNPSATRVGLQTRGHVLPILVPHEHQAWNAPQAALRLVQRLTPFHVAACAILWPTTAISRAPRNARERRERLAFHWFVCNR